MNRVSGQLRMAAPNGQRSGIPIQVPANEPRRIQGPPSNPFSDLMTTRSNRKIKFAEPTPLSGTRETTFSPNILRQSSERRNENPYKRRRVEVERVNGQSKSVTQKQPMSANRQEVLDVEDDDPIEGSSADDLNLTGIDNAARSASSKDQWGGAFNTLPTSSLTPRRSGFYGSASVSDAAGKRKLPSSSLQVEQHAKAPNKVKKMSEIFDHSEDMANESTKINVEPRSNKVSSMRRKGEKAPYITSRHWTSRRETADPPSEVDRSLKASNPSRLHTPPKLKLPVLQWIAGPYVSPKGNEDRSDWLLLTTHVLYVSSESDRLDEGIKLKIPLREKFRMLQMSNNNARTIYPLAELNVDHAFLTLDGDRKQKDWSGGDITFKFDTGHPNWSPGAYQALIDLLREKLHEDGEFHFVGPEASSPMWEMALKRADSLSRDDDWELDIRGHIGREVDSEIDRPRGTDPESSCPSEGRRRSSRLTRSRQSPPRTESPQADPDEIILVYPPSATGAVNITNSVLRRLRPGEFLNDTLIEFGLKLWLNNLKFLNPSLADDFHVFSSFFYKKLRGRSPSDGYQSVRKWTARFDLFKKKYIIVPINENVHWYLAIICYPGHSLLDPLPTTIAPTRTTRKRKSSFNDIALPSPQKSSSPDLRHVCMVEEDQDEVAEVVQSTRKVSLQEHQRLGSQSPQGAESSVSTEELSYPYVDLGGDMASSSRMDVDVSLGRSSRAASPPIELDFEDHEIIADDDKDPLTTHIFTLDSMGSGHSAAVKTLQKYLEDEARDKKFVETIRKAAETGKKVGGKIPVPTQPNFCDCGIYLLHFTRLFMEDPERCISQALKWKWIKNPPKEEVDAFWRDNEVPLMRDALRGDILRLAAEAQQSEEPLAAHPDRPILSNPAIATTKSRSESEIDEVNNMLDPRSNSPEPEDSDDCVLLSYTSPTRGKRTARRGRRLADYAQRS